MRVQNVTLRTRKQVNAPAKRRLSTACLEACGQVAGLTCMCSGNENPSPAYIQGI